MSSSSSPGRELAIETLIDMEPAGARYRAARVLEEAVPNALSSRSNLITRAALVEQAHALHKHEVDSVKKYNGLYAAAAVTTPREASLDSDYTDRILAHHAKLTKSPNAASPPLVSALRDVCGDSSILRSLLKQVMEHVEEEDEEAEGIVGRICQQSCSSGEEVVLHGLLIASLVILTSSVLSAEEKEGSLKTTLPRGDYLDPVLPSLQIGSVLSLLKCESSKGGEFSLDSTILEYLGQASAVFQEREELQQKRAAKTKSRELSPIPVAPLTPNNEAAESAQEVEAEEDEVEEEAGEQAEGDAVPAQDEGDALAAHFEDEEEAEDSDSTDDSEERYQPQVPQDDDDDDIVELIHDDSSSSSSDSEHDDDEMDDDDEEDSEVEEDDMLREALALSLVDQGPSWEGGQNREESSPPPLMPANRAESSDEEEEEDEPPLPPLPPAPSHYPYAALLETLSDVDVDRDEERSAYLDPAELSKFGAVPSAHALIHVLHYALQTVERRRAQEGKEVLNSIPGGMGSSLFEPKLIPYGGQKQDCDTDTAVSVQLLVSTFLIMDRNRRHAIDNLRHAIAAEQRNLQGEEDDEDERDVDSPLSAEDDPALALALNYVQEEDAPPSMSESLENKGMRRKAAAAAEEAEARLKALRKQTDAWRKRVKLLSQCTLLSMKCLSEYLRSTVSRWFTSPQTSVVDFHDHLPSAMISKLSDTLKSLMSIDEHRSHASLGDDTCVMEDVFLPLDLYREALLTWGECLPILHSSSASRCEILTCIMKGYVSVAGSASADLYSLEALPSFDTELQLHKLQVLCRRLCVSDLLNGLVARPACYTSEEEPESRVNLFSEETSEPSQFSKLVKLVASTASVCQEPIKGDVERLYLSLCHRCNVQVLLWDGLFSCSQVDTDDIMASSPSAALSTADLIRVSPNPSSNLQFDPSKCSDSIAILSNHSDSPSPASGPSVHQRASKVWGAVLSSSFYNPKTGVHRWAVRLDRCERGHVFVGVATAQASTRTYVGGDKYGWGVIGTQALWHDRRKIRGDYGATFRTGSTIIVTLDTDAGTLSFSSWKDSSSTSTSFSLDPSLQSGSSPTRRLAGGGTIEDWGVAFEGLPLDSRLYPAVGLYQRDDRVTLLNVESGGRSSGRDGILNGDLSGGLCYYPSVPRSVVDIKADVNRISQVRKHNDVLSWDGILYATDFLSSLRDSLSSKEGPSEALLSSVLPSVAAAISLVPPSIPMLSQRFGVTVLPHLSRCIQELHRATKKSTKLFAGGIKPGKWVIRATGSSGGSECEEYVVDFSTATDEEGQPIGFYGSGIGTTGKSKNGLVSIMGALNGSAIHFVEEWTDGNDEEATSSDSSTSSCVVTARMNFDGMRFEGTYRNVQYGTAGQIAGFFTTPTVPEDDCQEFQDLTTKYEALLCLAQGHLAGILAEDIAGDHVCEADLWRPENAEKEEWASHCLALKEWVSSPLLANGLVDRDDEHLSESLTALQRTYAPPLPEEVATIINKHGSTKLDIKAGESDSLVPPEDLAGLVDKVDDKMTVLSGGRGSLASLCPLEYSTSRRKIISALIHHGDLFDELVKLSKEEDSTKDTSNDLIAVWRTSLRIMEDSIRKTLSSSQDTKQTRQVLTLTTCGDIDRASGFLLSVRADRQASWAAIMPQVAAFYATVRSEEDLSYMKGEMECSTKRALLRMSALKEVSEMLAIAEENKVVFGESVAAECTIGLLPRLMGRVWAKIDKSRYDTAGRDDLGGYYLSTLSGAASVLVDSIRKTVSSIYESFASLLEEINENSTQSLVLSTLAANINTIRASDVPAVLEKSGILEFLPRILAAYRDSMHWSQINLTTEWDNVAVIGQIRDIAQRDASRAVLRAAVSVVHVMIYQLIQHIAQTTEGVAGDDLVKPLRRCLKLVFDEVGTLIPLIESVVKKGSSDYATVLAEEDWESWCGVCLPGGYQRPPENNERRTRGKAGVAYLNDHGVGSHLIGNQLPLPKPATRGAGSTTPSERTTRSEYFSGLLQFSCQQYLSRWLNVVACLTKSPTSLQLLVDDWHQTEILLTAIGLSCAREEGEIMTSAVVRDYKMAPPLPARYRARIMRLLRAVIAQVTPSPALIEGLLSVVGASTSIVGPVTVGDENLASREAISLLRHLYLPSYPTWRACLRDVITCHLSAEDGNNTSQDVCLGIRVFLGGSIGELGRGSYVLLKPAAASLLSPEAQSSPSSKSSSAASTRGEPSGIGFPSHHVAGNGTECVVSGLCRSEATAGIVSSILLKNGACEVILMNRHRMPRSEGIEDSVDSPDVDELGSSSSRQSLTVRAIRTPLSDVALADEVPLHTDPSLRVESLLGRSGLSSLGSDGNAGDEVTNTSSIAEDDSHTEALADDYRTELGETLVTLRSAMALTSNKGLLQSFLKEKSSSETLARLLRFAHGGNKEGIESESAETLRSESLLELPKREAQYLHLIAMLGEIKRRSEVLNELPITFWEKLLEEQLAARESAEKEKSKDDDKKTGRSSTPLVESGSTPEVRPSTARAPTRDQGDSETRSNEPNRVVSQSTVSANSTDEEEESEAAAAAAAQLREAAIAQMAELGLPRSWSELALRRTGGTNIEAAVHFCLERGGDMERLIAEEHERERMMRRQTSGGSTRRRGSRGDNTNHLLRQLLEMGFPSRWCAEALAATGNNVDEALTWILTNGERLSAEDLGMEEEFDEGDDMDDEDSAEEEDDDDDEEEDEEERRSASGTLPDASSDGPADQQQSRSPTVSATEGTKSSNAAGVDTAAEEASEEPIGWSGSVAPLRFISGRSIINSKTLAVSGLPSGGFSSVGTKGILLTSGKWYYEAILETAGCLQIGWADGSFSGHCNADRGDGCGDGPSSWAYDGWRRYRWHASATEWGCRWKEGDVVGCLVDLDDRVVSFTLNGQAEEIGMGVAFSGQGFRPCGGVYACVSFNRREKLRLILGGETSEPFKHQPPPGYRGVGEAVLLAVDERDKLVKKEQILHPSAEDSTSDDKLDSKRFLCDFSDGEHGHELFAWQHRYYGSDASVHLGSARHAKQPTEAQKSSSGSSFSAEAVALASISRRVRKRWAAEGQICEELTPDLVADPKMFISKVKESYDNVAAMLENELRSEAGALGILYCRKLILHAMVTLGKDFDLECFIPTHNIHDSDSELAAARQLWSVFETCVSLRPAGWVGEAGAMAVAAEALGLGISSASSRQNSVEVRGGIFSAGESDNSVLLPSAGLSQVLSNVLISSIPDGATSSTLAACAETAIGGGGSLVFLQPSLQSIVSKSSIFQDLLVAVIRRSVRLLAVVDYAGDDASSENLEDDDMDGSSNSFESSRLREGQSEDELGSSEQPDARLAMFLTGLLLSRPASLSPERKRFVLESLFEAWSVGLLSASAPWRMVCALSAAGVLNFFPGALLPALESLPTVSRYYERLQSTVTRRVWAERAAVPVCSRYAQAMIDLLSSVRRALHLLQPNVPDAFCREKLWVDAATPFPFKSMMPLTEKLSQEGPKTPASLWEWEDGWLSSDDGWEVWTGSVECMTVDWKAPSRSAVRTLMDGGEGPPMLRVGCKVMRGLDWGEDGSGSIDHGNEDGKDAYEAEKAKREKEKRSLEEKEAASEAPTPSAQTDDSQSGSAGGDADPSGPVDESSGQPPPEQQSAEADTSVSQASSEKKKKKKRRKIPNPKLPVGTVLSIEPWKGMPAVARRVKWDLTGIEGVYRYGGDGGRFDISHVEVNEKCTRVRKRHPFPESAEQCAFRHGFGVDRKYSVLLRLRKERMERVVDEEVEYFQQGILEWPDFGAGIRVDCVMHSDGAVSITEKELIYGSKDSGWEARFGQPSYVPGTVMVLTTTGSQENQADLDARSSFLSLYEELLGSSSFTVEALRNRADGNKIRVTSEMRLLRSKRVFNGITDPIRATQVQTPAPLSFDRNLHAPSISLSKDGRTITCVAPDGRGTAFAATGFTKGVHYWEVKLEQADIGSVYIGVAEKPTPGGSGGSPFGQESPPRLNRWHGWGFVNFRATYTAGAERVYGAHCHAGDTVGVLLDCDAGRVSFFFDGLKYGEHILNDLGCAFENLSPYGFNADGCGSGGAGQGAPSGIEGGRGGRYPAQGSVRPRALWPVVGLRNPGDRVTLSAKWMTSSGIDGPAALENALAVDEVLCTYGDVDKKTTPQTKVTDVDPFPSWFVKEAFFEYERWRSGRWLRAVTRGSGAYRMTSFGLDVNLDASPVACAAACAGLGLKHALLSGDRVMVKRSAGRMLELAEEAVVLGAHEGRLFYRIVSQKSEGGSLTEGGGRAWFWDESEVVDDGIQLLGEGKGRGISLPLLDRFTCLSAGGLKIVYEGGAVVRSDLEIFDGSANIGSLPAGTVIPHKDVLERRVNSCGVVRYRIRFGENGTGWISAWIRGGKEDAIVQPVHEASEEASTEEDSSASYGTPQECARKWYNEYCKQCPPDKDTDDWKVEDVEEFKTLLSQGVLSGKTVGESDCLLVSVAGAIADCSESGDAVDCTFSDIAAPLALAVSTASSDPAERAAKRATGQPRANQVAMAMLSSLPQPLPSAKALLARMAMLRSFNRRARMALPWLSVRPSQEGNAIFGGLSGHGASIDRVGRYRQHESLRMWVQVPSIGCRVRALRRLFFTCVKRSLLESITESTTTPTPLSHDEYELPREIRTVRINRLKARRAMASDDTRCKRKNSVFSQLQSETRSWGGAALRRGFVAKGHGGQKRAFKVKLIGEGVNDYSGPYREAFTDAMHEVHEVDDNGRGYLGVLDATPNNASDIGDSRDLYMFSTGDRDLTTSSHTTPTLSEEEARILKSFSSVTMTRDEVSREVEESLVFLGRVVGTACRHGIPVELPMPLNTVWKAIAEEETDDVECLRELDLLASRQVSSDEKPLLLQWQQRMLNSFMDGLSNVFPDEILTLMTGEEIRDVLCGNPDIDVDLLKRVVEYEGFDEDDDVIVYFWEALREMSSDDRKKFLQFVWARNRLPLKESAFEAPFKIQRDTAGPYHDAALPSASTCFFSLTLPEYSSKEILKEKLLFAIENVVTMESDYVTNDAEVGEGWRGV